MKAWLSGISQRRPIGGLAQKAKSFVRGIFHFEARTLMRENAIRSAIASLVETERMRLAPMSGHRGDG